MKDNPSSRYRATEVMLYVSTPTETDCEKENRQTPMTCDRHAFLNLAFVLSRLIEITDSIYFSFQAGGVFSRDMKKGGKINPTTTYVKFGILGSSPYQSTLNALPTVHLCDTVPRSISLYYVFLVSSIGGLYHFEKRCHFAASPATGLVGMAENYFLSDYFDCMGLIPLATRRQGRSSTVLWTYSLRTSFPLSK